MEQNKFSAVATRVLAVVGFLAIIGFGLWGTATVARSVPNVLSTLGSVIVSLTSVFVPGGEESITVSAPVSVETGETFNLTWRLDGSESKDGLFTFRYSCVSGVTFSSPSVSGSPVSVFCNTPFNFLNASDSITVTAQSSNTSNVSVELIIDFTKNGENKPSVSGSTLLTIAPSAPDETPSAPSPSAPRSPGAPTTTVRPISGNQVSNPSGFIDLAPRIIEVGLVDKTSGAFAATTTPNRTLSTHRVAVRFAIENLGTKTSGQWTFNAVLPTFPSHIFSSPTQQALGPGDRIEYTLSFDSFVDADEGILTINIDPVSRINEPNKENNILKYTVVTTE